MARRRTKKDKIIAQLRRQVQDKKATYAISPTPTIVFEAKSPLKGSLSQSSIKAPDYLSLFSGDPRLIQKDLIKSVLLSVVAFGIIMGLNFFLK